MPERRAGRRAGHLVLTGIILIFLLLAITWQVAAHTIIFGGQVNSQGSATITYTITINNLANLPQDAYVTFNAPVFDNFADDGFSQTIAWQPQAVSPVPQSVTDYHDVSPNLDIRYKQYRWSLNNLSDTSFTATVTSTFNYVVTANPQPYAFTDSFTSPGGVTAGATTEAEAVDKIANYVKLNDPGNCVGRANLTLAQLQSAGIQGRVVQGVTIDTPYETPEFIIDNIGYKLIRSWNKELHVWVEVYYPDEGRWVSYDPALNKGFVDQRHLAMGTSPATDSALHLVHVFANYEASPKLDVTISFTGVTDSGSYMYRYDDPSPSALDIPHALIGRDMANKPLPTPGPTPVVTPTPVPSATPTANATITPRPNTTISPTPTQAVNVTATPTRVPPVLVVNNDTNVSEGTGQATYNISGKVTDTDTLATLSGAIITLDGQPVRIDTQGSFSVTTTNGTHQLIISVPGFGSRSFMLTVAGADVLQDVPMSRETTGNSGSRSGFFVPGFEAVAAVIGLLIIALYRYGRA